MGLVNRVVPADELESYVKNYADTIAGNAPLTVKAVKFIVGETVQGREQARPRALPTNWSRPASPATTTSKAAGPSWRSASRFSPGSDDSAACPSLAFPRGAGEPKAASCRGRGYRFRSINHRRERYNPPRHCGRIWRGVG